MKKVLLALTTAAAVLLTSTANAAVYQMTEMRYAMSFITLVPYIKLMPQQTGSQSNVSLAGACYSCVGGNAAIAYATTSGSAVSVTGANWYVGTAPGATTGTEYTALWDFTTTIGGNSLTKTTNINTVLSGTFGENGTKAGFGGTTLGTGVSAGNPSIYDLVSVTQTGNQLLVKIQRGLDNTTSGFTSTKIQSYTMVFTEVPVPAAAWLMGSGLVGLAGVARRRKMA